MACFEESRIEWHYFDCDQCPWERALKRFSVKWTLWQNRELDLWSRRRSLKRRLELLLRSNRKHREAVELRMLNGASPTNPGLAQAAGKTCHCDEADLAAAKVRRETCPVHGAEKGRT